MTSKTSPEHPQPPSGSPSGPPTLLSRLRGLSRWVLIACVAVFSITGVVTWFLARSARSAFPPLGTYVDVDGLRLHYVERGTEHSGPPIVVLHGSFGALQDVEATILDDLAKTHRVIALDRPGHGYSERPGEVATPRVQARIVRSFLREIDAERPVLVGFSWGASVSAAFAAEYPDDLAALVVVSAPLYDWRTFTSWTYRITRVPVLGRCLAYTLGPPIATLVAGDSVADAFSPAPIAPHFSESPIGLALTPTGYFANGEDMAILQESLGAQELRYGEITAPTVIVVGEGDLVASPQVHSYPFRDAVPGAELISISDGGHQLLYSHPADVLAGIERAIERSR